MFTTDVVANWQDGRSFRYSDEWWRRCRWDSLVLTRKRRSAMTSHELAIAILRKKWTPDILLALRSGRRRFSDLHRELPLISHKVLIQQLRALERDRLIRREVIAEHPLQVSYELSDAGKSLLPIIDALEQWSRHNASVIKRTKTP